jgi:hypothetical protein
MFAAITNPGLTSADFVPLTTELDAWENYTPKFQTHDERLWRVRSMGAELQRSSADGQAPLTETAIVGPATPAGASRSNTVTFKTRVRVQSQTGFYEFDMDMGQPVEVFGKSVRAVVLGPSNGFQVTPTTQSNTLQGIVLDAVVRIGINAAEVSLGQTAVRLTSHHFVLRNTRVTIAVPRFARALKIYTGVGAMPASWERHIGDPAIITSLLTGTVDFAGPTSIDASNQVGDETHLRTDLDANNDRFFTIVWTIKP